MKNLLISGFTGLILGIILMGAVIYNMAPSMMILVDESKYDFEQTTIELEKSIKENGWSMPAVHDLQKSMKKFGHDIKSVKVYELCHPTHANKILQADDERSVASLMPCRVAIYEKNDGNTYISRMNSGLMAKTMGKLINDVMNDASAENEVILNAILKKK
ncbi:MAG: DUF302 domain-containing protein [Bacteroidales bacterium]|nr:DUF302 domain-containing protein [Bacteroidales bacterium]MBN2757968.1 DUF302 domain-containing protein [Bacteroidales bacterium]